jgi:hypothetical protein
MDEIPEENVVSVNLILLYSLTENGNRASFQNVVFLLKNYMLAKVHKERVLSVNFSCSVFSA